MKAINIAGAFVVLICNLVVSYNHSIELFQAGGFSGWMAHVAVIGAETTFILGALNLVVSRLRGDSPGGPAIMGGVLGVLLVSWSNVAAGWEHGVVGILLGLATPASLVVAEAILSRAIIQEVNREEQEEAVETSPARVEEPPAKVEERVEDLEAHVEEPPDPLEVARRILEREGEPPGRKRLMEEAQCSEWAARTALAKLRERLAS